LLRNGNIVISNAYTSGKTSRKLTDYLDSNSRDFSSSQSSEGKSVTAQKNL